MKLSVVIPVYHVENTLERCVRSVLQQDYEDMQIILVDDGSTDHSPAICEWLASQDKRISVIHQQNRGLAAARNVGIRSAQGSYITFVDSDDYLDNNTYLPLMHELVNHPEYDILEYPVLIKEGGKHMSRLSFDNVCYNSFLDYWLKGKGYRHCFAWNKIYRRDLFDQCLFKEQFAFEDVWTLPQLLNQSTQIATTAVGCYHYCENLSGITANANIQDMQSLLNAHVQILPKVWNFTDASLFYYIEVLNIQITVAQMGGEVLLPPYPYKMKMTSALNIKQRIKILLLKILGVNLLCRMFKCLKRL